MEGTKGAHFTDQEGEPQRASDKSGPRSESSLSKPGPFLSPAAPKPQALPLLVSARAKESPQDESPEGQAPRLQRRQGTVSLVQSGWL